MNRNRMQWEARRMLRNKSPGLAAHVVESIVNSAPLQRWFDNIERKRPRGLVALFRRLRGKDRGLTDEQREQLEEFLRVSADKYL